MNLKNSFPEKSNKEIMKISKEFYKRFTYYVVETLKILTITEEELKSRIKPVRCEEYEEYAKEGQSVLNLATHQFNWEWSMLASKLYFDFEIDAVYQKIKHPSFNQLMIDIRSRFGIIPVEKDNIMRIARDTSRVRAIGFVADQAPPRRMKGVYWTTFLNQETGFFPSPDTLPKLTKYPVFLLKTRFIKKGYYEFEAIKLADPPYEKGSTDIIDRYIKETENMIREEPEGWLWTHKRWKRKKPDHYEE